MSNSSPSPELAEVARRYVQQRGVSAIATVFDRVRATGYWTGGSEVTIGSMANLTASVDADSLVSGGRTPDVGPMIRTAAGELAKLTAGFVADAKAATDPGLWNAVAMGIRSDRCLVGLPGGPVALNRAEFSSHVLGLGLPTDDAVELMTAEKILDAGARGRTPIINPLPFGRF